MQLDRGRLEPLDRDKQTLRDVGAPLDLGGEGVEVCTVHRRLLPLGLQNEVRAVEREPAVDLLPRNAKRRPRVQIEGVEQLP